jgi:hypothetical protein
MWCWWLGRESRRNPFAGLGYDDGDARVAPFSPLEATLRYSLLTIPPLLHAWG